MGGTRGDVAGGALTGPHPYPQARQTAASAATQAPRLAITSTGTRLGHGPLPASGNQSADVGQRDGPFPRRLVSHVAREPLGVELLLVVAHTLEVVPLL